MSRAAASAAAVTALLACAGLTRIASSAQYGSGAPPVAPKPTADISSCAIPKDAETRLPPFPYDQRPYFDDYSWRAFAALICAAQPGKRGVAGSSADRDGSGPRVFETFKAAWEVYRPGKTLPDWDAYDDPRDSPCRGAQPGDLVLAATSKFSDSVFADAAQFDATGNPIGALPAQNGTYVRYLTQYNKKSFEHIRDVLAGKIPANTAFPDGSVNIKSAWVEMKHLDRARFYTRKAWVQRSPGHCDQTLVGLVGLHIVQKTPSRQPWIWTTFEQVNNAPDAGAPCPQPGARFTFNKGDCKPMPPSWPIDNAPNASPVDRFNVYRTFYPISPRTKCTNEAYQEKLRAGSAHGASKWTNYELVMTQWPLPRPAQAPVGDLEYIFPGKGPDAAFANTAMETFFQGNVKQSCLACHAVMADKTDLVWSLSIERVDSRDDAIRMLTTALKATPIQ